MGKELHTDFGIRLQDLRNNRWQGIYDQKKKRRTTTQEKFAEAVGVSVDTVRNWEQGRVLPEMEKLFKIAEVLDCDLDYLTGRLREPTHDIQFIHEQTGLSEKAIKKLQQLKPDWEQLQRSMIESTLDIPENKINDSVRRQSDYHDSIAGDFPEVLSLLIEDTDFEYLLSLITRRVTGYNPHKKKRTHKDFIQDELWIDFDGQKVPALKRNLLDSLIQSEVANMIPIITEKYHKKCQK